MKTVSVVMCTHNGAPFLREQLDSIISQSYPVYEVIIQDDCSTDDTCNIVAEYQSLYSYIHLYVNEYKMGVHPNFGTALLRATGEYICPSDQDDIWHPYKIETLINTIENKCNGEGDGDGVAYSSDEILYPNLQMVYMNWNICSNIYTYLYKSIAGHTTMISKKYVKCVSYATENGLPFDYTIGLLGIFDASIFYVDKPLQIWRRHSATVTSSVCYSNDSMSFVENMSKISKWCRFLACCIWLTQGTVADGVRAKYAALHKSLFFFEESGYIIDEKVKKIVALLSKPNLQNIIKAGLISMTVSDKMYGKPNSFRIWLINKSRAFRCPFDFIWSVRKEKYL